jgi:hypothetical protein
MLTGVHGTLQDLSRLEAGKVELSDDVFSPWQAATQALHMVSARAMERQIKLEVEVDCPQVRDVLVKGDGECSPLRTITVLVLIHATLAQPPRSAKSSSTCYQTHASSLTEMVPSPPASGWM